MSNMANLYYLSSNYEAPLFYNKYVTNKVDPMVFNGNPPKPINGTIISQEIVLRFKLKDLFHDDKCIKSKAMIQDCLGYSFSFNSYLNLRSVALQCPLNAKPTMRSFNSFHSFLGII